MDRLSFAFFAAAFLITGTAVAGLALRAGMPVADASVAAGFGEVVAAGSSSTPLRRDEAGPERAEAATAPAGPTTGTRIARHAPAPRVRPMPAGAPAAAAAPTCEAALVIECVPGVAWTEEQHAALAASVARAEQARPIFGYEESASSSSGRGSARSSGNIASARTVGLPSASASSSRSRPPRAEPTAGSAMNRLSLACFGAALLLVGLVLAALAARF